MPVTALVLSLVPRGRYKRALVFLRRIFHDDSRKSHIILSDLYSKYCKDRGVPVGVTGTESHTRRSIAEMSERE
jgi:hypothetical protein